MSTLNLRSVGALAFLVVSVTSELGALGGEAGRSEEWVEVRMVERGGQ